MARVYAHAYRLVSPAHSPSNLYVPDPFGTHNAPDKNASRLTLFLSRTDHQIWKHRARANWNALRSDTDPAHDSRGILIQSRYGDAIATGGQLETGHEPPTAGNNWAVPPLRAAPVVPTPGPVGDGGAVAQHASDAQVEVPHPDSGARDEGRGWKCRRGRRGGWG